MKKIVSVLVGTSLLMSGGIVSAHGVQPHPVQPVVADVAKQSQEAPKANEELTVLVNGVKVVSEANHIASDKKVYVSVKAFADLFGKTYTVAQNKHTVTLNGKTIDGISMKSGEPTAWVEDLAKAVGAQKVSWDETNKEAYVLALPEGTIQVTEVVPAMGEHWGNPQELPLGPIYGVYKGKLVFLEYMISQADLAQGKSLANVPGMKGLPMPGVVQVDWDFEPNGHPGFEVPHYDIHNYFISDEEQQKIQ
ncbi:hypothetical protein ACQCN2_19345 [Brevibacillus ginsengisoli]|uniref:hypothetical protein n=1 Tax=Brevibacillus ginsengisoli TaxID=363854 RepID=UPI003CF9ADBD